MPLYCQHEFCTNKEHLLDGRCPLHRIITCRAHAVKALMDFSCGRLQVEAAGDDRVVVHAHPWGIVDAAKFLDNITPWILRATPQDGIRLSNTTVAVMRDAITSMEDELHKLRMRVIAE